MSKMSKMSLHLVITLSRRRRQRALIAPSTTRSSKGRRHSSSRRRAGASRRRAAPVATRGSRARLKLHILSDQRVDRVQ